MLKSIPSQIHLYLIGMSVFKNTNTETGAKRLVGGEKQYLASHPLFFWILNDVICSHRSSLLSWISMEPSCCFFPIQTTNQWEDICVSCLVHLPLWLVHHCYFFLLLDRSSRLETAQTAQNTDWRTCAWHLSNTPCFPFSLPACTLLRLVLFWFFLKEGTTKRERPF